MGPPETGSQDTPLAPSVEKAYYRKCIELKRRLNDVEGSNDELKTKRVRLDRAIMKMRLERAFLLEQLCRRMDPNVDGSEGSGDEGMATPPPDRPHRDKRRRTNTQPQPTLTAPPSRDAYQPSYLAQQPPSFEHMQSHPYMPPAPVGMPGAAMNGNGSMERDDDRHELLRRDISRGDGEGVVGEALSAGPPIREDSNGERRVAGTDGFTAVNQ